MSTTQAHVESKIRRSKPVIAAEPAKSAGALRMQRLRRQRKHIQAVAVRLRANFFEEMFRMLADETPNGSTIKAAEMINEAWLKAGHVPAPFREYLNDKIQ